MGYSVRLLGIGQKWVCRFALVISIICLSYLHELFLLIMVHGRSVFVVCFYPYYIAHV